MLSAFSKASAWINTMSTNDPGTSDRSPDPGSTAPADDRGSATMFALPDSSVIARLANEFFAALPSNAAVPENVGARAPARATTGPGPMVPSSPPAPAGVTALTPTIPNVPESPAAPGSLAYFLDRTSPLNATPTFPSLNEAFVFQAVPGAQTLPGIPGMPDSPLTSLTEADLRAIPTSLGDVPSFTPGIPATSSPSTPGSSAYFLDFEKIVPLTATPSFPDIARMFSFPGVPGMQSIPGVPGLPSSPPTDLSTLPNAVSAPTVPGSSSFAPGVEKAPGTATPPLSIGSFEFHPNLVPDVAASPRPLIRNLFLRLAVLEHLEVGGGQAAHHRARVVADDYVDGHECVLARNTCRGWPVGACASIAGISAVNSAAASEMGSSRCIRT